MAVFSGAARWHTIRGHSVVTVSLGGALYWHCRTCNKTLGRVGA